MIYKEYYLPVEFKGKKLPDMKVKAEHGSFLLQNRRKWTKQEEDWLLYLKDDIGLSFKDISICIDREEQRTRLKYKRLNKKNKTYNKTHIVDKYKTNLEILENNEIETCLDLFASEKSFWEDYIKNVTSNDIIPSMYNTYNLKAEILAKYLNDNSYTFDLIDIDPFGSAFNCFENAIEMCNKVLIITYGEIGHKRWKRLDFVKKTYKIKSLDEFTIENLINYTKKIALKKNVILEVDCVKNWHNISRVYYKVLK